MNLKKKKKLAARTFSVGLDRIIFVQTRLGEIKEAITKQDMRGLKKSGAVIICNKRGRKKGKRISSRIKRKTIGQTRIKVNMRKKKYVILTRKLRKHISSLKKEEKIDKESFRELRKKIRNKEFKSKSNLKTHIAGV